MLVLQNQNQCKHETAKTIANTEGHSKCRISACPFLARVVEPQFLSNLDCSTACSVPASSFNVSSTLNKSFRSNIRSSSPKALKVNYFFLEPFNFFPKRLRARGSKLQPATCRNRRLPRRCLFHLQQKRQLEQPLAPPACGHFQQHSASKQPAS